jgi:hypothetical protein
VKAADSWIGTGQALRFVYFAKVESMLSRTPYPSLWLMLRTRSSLTIRASTAADRQPVRGRNSLVEHSHQGIEVALILIAEIARKTGHLLAIENHQLGQSGGVRNRSQCTADERLSSNCICLNC